jgi:hypothetical protein
MSESRHHPDVMAAGSLAAAIEAAADRLGRPAGSVLPTEHAPLTSASVHGESASRGRLSVGTDSALRGFRVEGWGGGICLLVGDLDELGDVVEVVRLWRDGTPLRDIERLVPSVELTSRGAVFDQGPEHVVAGEWQRVRQGTPGGDDTNLHALVEAAYREPRLRRLYPYTSHEVLNFSTTTGYPFSPSPVSLTAYGEGKFRVWNAAGAVLGDTATAEEAVALGVAHLPADLGPAVAGSYHEPG